MPQSLAQIYLHLVFSTKNRTPFLQDAALRTNLHAYLAGACKNLGCPAVRVGGVADHVHIATRFARNITIADLVRDLKRESSRWLKTRSPTLQDFRWQEGYGAFSVSPAHLPPLVEYIARQEEHHRRETFADELRRLLDKYGVEYDERHLWD